MNWKRTALSATLLLMGLMSGCGDVSKLLVITPDVKSHNLFGVGSTVQMKITAYYSDNNAVDITSRASYQSSNPSAVQVSDSGQIQVISAYCDWNSATTVDPNLQITVTASFKNQSTTILVNVNSQSGCPGPTSTM